MMASPSPNTRGGLGIPTPRRILLRIYKCVNPAPSPAPLLASNANSAPERPGGDHVQSGQDNGLQPQKIGYCPCSLFPVAAPDCCRCRCIPGTGPGAGGAVSATLASLKTRASRCRRRLGATRGAARRPRGVCRRGPAPAATRGPVPRAVPTPRARGRCRARPRACPPRPGCGGRWPRRPGGCR